MSTKTQSEFSISMRSARKRTRKTPTMLNAPDVSSIVSAEPVVMASSNSTSPLTKLYASDAFRLAWDNEISFHVAENATHLRRFRKKSQAFVARSMGTSQSKVARIEGGDENITIRTLKRLANALK